MAGPDYGALGATFKIVRVLQAISMIAMIGMTANFISQMVSSTQTPSDVLIGTLSVVCISVMYCIITLILFVDNILPFLVNTGLDCMFLIAVIVVAVTVGKPLSYLDCNAIGSTSTVDSAYDFTTSLASSLDKNGGNLSYNYWIGVTKTACLEMKAIWGLSISLCILFAFSAICSVCLWRRKPAVTPKDIEN